MARFDRVLASGMRGTLDGVGKEIPIPRNRAIIILGTSAIPLRSELICPDSDSLVPRSVLGLNEGRGEDLRNINTGGPGSFMVGSRIRRQMNMRLATTLQTCAWHLSRPVMISLDTYSHLLPRM